MTHDELRQAVVFAARFEFYDQDFIRRGKNGKPIETKHGADLSRIASLSPGEIDWDQWTPVVNVIRRREYWRRVLPSSWTNAQVDQYAKSKAWCGGFALWCLREAGLAAGVSWIDQVGFLAKNCRAVRLGKGEAPKPGDVAFFKAKQHHAVVEAVRPVFVTMPDGSDETPAFDMTESEFDSIDGNQPAIELRTQRPFFAAYAFYSIEPLLVARG